MSIRHGLLALLDAGPTYGYQLRAEFERATGGTWPLNIGQVYTTLNRLERDNLVEPAGTDEGGRIRYAITAAGREAVGAWFGRPVPRDARPRDELAIKLAMALTVPGAEVGRIVQTQRTATLRTLQEYTRLKRDPNSGEPGGRDDSEGVAWSLVLDSMIFQAEAEIRWLDHCEARLARAAGSGRAAQPTRGRTGESAVVHRDDRDDRGVRR